MLWGRKRVGKKNKKKLVVNKKHAIELLLYRIHVHVCVSVGMYTLCTGYN